MRTLQTVLLLKLALGCVHFASCADKYSFCKTPACKHAENLLLSSIDKSVEPCDDIYQYVCGTWIKSHTNSDGQTLERQTSQPDVKNLQRTRLHNILNEKSKCTDTMEIKFARKLYKQCLYKAKREKGDLTSLKRHIKQIGGWPLLTPKKELPANTKWQHIYKKIDRYFSSASLYNMKITKTDDSYALLLAAPNTFLPYVRRFAGKLGSKDVILTSYRKFIDNVSCELAGNMKLLIDPKKLSIEIDDIINFEKKILQARSSSQANSNSSKHRRTFTIDECRKMFDVGAVGNGDINWLEMIQNKFGIKSDLQIVVPKRHYFTGLSALLEKTPTRTIVNYIVWHFIRSLLPYTTEKMQTFLETAEGKGKMNWEKRVQVCLEMPNLKYAVDYEYVKRYFNEDKKEEVLQILHDITTATRENIEEATWMDIATKRRFMEEVDSRVLHVLYPDNYNSITIEHYYEKIDKSTFNLTFLDNVIKVLQFDAGQDKAKIGQRIRPREWQLTSYRDELSAAYTFKSVSMGSLRVPAGMIHDVLYHPDKPEAMNYGAVGYLLGYDIITGYGFLYKLICDNAAASPCRNQHLNTTRRNCVTDYYNLLINRTARQRFSVADDVPLERFILDSAVISTVWKAWVKYKKRTNNFQDVRLPMLRQHTSDQLFFISIVYNFCENTLVGNRHSRLLSSFASLPAFANSFACAPFNTSPVKSARFGRK